MKEPKKKKIQKVSKIKRRLLHLWSQTVHRDHQSRCAICGLKTGDIVDGKVQKIDAHHIEDKTNYALRFNRKNGILLCVWHHKFGKDSAHRSPTFFIEWMKKVRPQQLTYIQEHRNDEIDNDNKDILAQIESDLKKPLSQEDRLFFNIADLENIESKKHLNPMFVPQNKSKIKKAKGHLFDDIENIESKSSSSSSS